MPEEVWIVNPWRCVVPGPCPWTLFELRVYLDALKKVDWWSLREIVSISKEELIVAGLLITIGYLPRAATGGRVRLADRQ